MSPETKIEATRSRGIAWVVGVGASRGLGAAAARRFARSGFTVAVTGRSPDTLEAIVTEIKAAGGQAIVATGDAQDEASMIALLHRLEEMGPVEVGIYNAGNAAWGPPPQMRTADFEAVWRVGCLGGFIFLPRTRWPHAAAGPRHDHLFWCFGLAARQGGVRRVRGREGGPAYGQPSLRTRTGSEWRSYRPCDH
jgi:NAD(P)-dependent dehydrogenase (short-subunit alcohol dehydrogenase family)